MFLLYFLLAYLINCCNCDAVHRAFAGFTSLASKSGVNAADSNDGALCDRVCAAGEKPRECRFKFEVELYNSLNKVRDLNNA